MKLFDIVFFDADEGLAKRLGFAGLIRIDQSAVSYNPNKPNETVLMASNPPSLFKSMNSHGVKCIVIGIDMVNGNVMGKLAGMTKPLLISANEVVTTDRRETMANIGAARRSFARTKTRGLNIGLASLAKDPNYLFSLAQLVELSKLIGIDERVERRTLSMLGGMHAKKE
ncbi:MAG: hypothetical protein KGH74_03145 [Candidatus Micrarchaeota archaeon]|nr:hypothetical protein [Candidatus Micrarchaeota archaeon]